MLIIRTAQIKHLQEDLAFRRLRDRLARAFPNDFRIVGEVQFDTFTRLGISKALSYGLREHNELYIYVSLMILLGFGFDNDPQYPWASQILGSSDRRSSQIIASALLYASQDFLKTSAGEDAGNYRAALLRMYQSKLDQMPSLNTDDWTLSAKAYLEKLYPEHVYMLSKNELEKVLQLAEKRSQLWICDCYQFKLLVSALMIMLGAHFDSDPFHSWILPTLNSNLTGISKAEALHSAAVGRIRLYIPFKQSVR